MSIAITGAAGQLGRLVIDDLLSAGIPGTDLIAIARPRPEIGHLDEKLHLPPPVGSQASCHRPSFYVIPTSVMTRK